MDKNTDELFNSLKKKYNYDIATPVMKQYLDIKFKHMDCLLLFRMGDFYELFYEDAIIASEILSIALTKRNKNHENQIPMCGVPHHALLNYSNKLLAVGKKIALCDQVETPEEAKKQRGYKAVVKREVTKIITPGTIIEESILDNNKFNYLASVVINSKEASICYTNLVTAEIFVMSLPTSKIIDEIAKLDVKEILFNEEYNKFNEKNHEILELIKEVKQLLPSVTITYQAKNIFQINRAKRNIEDFYAIQNLSSIGNVDDLQIKAINSVIEYLNITQKQNLDSFSMPQIINYHNFMMIDNHTSRSLELIINNKGQKDSSLFKTINYTKTQAGSRLLLRFLSMPLIKKLDIEKRLDIVSIFFDLFANCEETRELLSKTFDLERCIAKLSMNNITPKDLLSLKHTIEIANQIKTILFNVKDNVNASYSTDILIEMITKITDNNHVKLLIQGAINEDTTNNINDIGFIKNNYHPKLEELDDYLKEQEQTLINIKNYYINKFQIDNIKISSNNIIGIFLEIPSRYAKKIEDDDLIHKQTTSSVIRYHTEKLKEIETNIINCKLNKLNLEKELYQNLIQDIKDHIDSLSNLAWSLKHLDVYCNFAFIAKKFNLVRPKITDNNQFIIENARHLPIEESLNSENLSFVSNDTYLSEDEKIWLITGPNMSGKSTFLRQNAQNIILSHIGCFVPASRASIGVTDKIFSRIGSGDNLSAGQSTFMVEMIEVASMIAQATEKSFIILDEVGRGTSTYDGVAIASSILEYIHDKIQARCLFATHYHELSNLYKTHPKIANYTVAIKEQNDAYTKNQKILFLHKIIKGNSNKSYGIYVAQMAGINKEIIDKAYKKLSSLENHSYQKTLFDTNDLMSNQSSNSNEKYHIDQDQDRLDELNQKYQILEKKFHNLSNKIKNINPDNLSPKQALDELYDLYEKSGEDKLL